MREIKYFVANSLDNFISRLDGGIDWLFKDQDYGMAEFFASVDVAVMGRKTLDRILELSPKTPLFPGMKHYVFSRTLESISYKEVEIVRGDAPGWAEDVRSQRGKHIWLVGGGSLVREFLQHKLVNEIGLAIHPRLLGKGSRSSRLPTRKWNWNWCAANNTRRGCCRLFIASSSLTSFRDDSRLCAATPHALYSRGVQERPSLCEPTTRQ